MLKICRQNTIKARAVSSFAGAAERGPPFQLCTNDRLTESPWREKIEDSGRLEAFGDAEFFSNRSKSLTGSEI